LAKQTNIAFGGLRIAEILGNAHAIERSRETCRAMPKDSVVRQPAVGRRRGVFFATGCIRSRTRRPGALPRPSAWRDRFPGTVRWRARCRGSRRCAARRRRCWSAWPTTPALRRTKTGQADQGTPVCSPPRTRHARAEPPIRWTRWRSRQRHYCVRASLPPGRFRFSSGPPSLCRPGRRSHASRSRRPAPAQVRPPGSRRPRQHRPITYLARGGRAPVLGLDSDPPSSSPRAGRGPAAQH